MCPRFLPPLLILASGASAALEPGCEAVLAATEARLREPAWHSIADLEGGMHIEVIKAEGKFFRRTDGNWLPLPMDIDEADRKMLALIRKGEVVLDGCRPMGADMVEGEAVTVLQSTITMAGMPPATSRIHIGKRDGLPYRQVGERFTVKYRYKGVAAPLPAPGKSP